MVLPSAKQESSGRYKRTNGMAEHSLTIDAEQTKQRIVAYLQDVVRRERSEGLLLGLSGGIDSAVLAALAVAALGPESVHLAYLFDRDSDTSVRANAVLVADRLGVELEVQDITAEMHKRRIYAPLFMRALTLSARLNRWIQNSYNLFCGETPFKSTLRVGSGERLRPWHKRLMFNNTMYYVDQSYSERHIHRRKLLEEKAKQENLTLIGAANRSEFEVGWFVKDGIDDLPVQPLSGLLKTQVKQLCFSLGLPEAVCSQAPSPDMTKGISDEFGIGHSYQIVDIVVDCLDMKLSDDEIASRGISQGELDDIRDLMRLSDWKRESPHENPPVEGRYDSPIRLGVPDVQRPHRSINS